MKSQQSKEESLYDGLKGSPNLGDSFVSGGDWDIDKDYLKYLLTLGESFNEDSLENDFQEEDTAVYIGISVGNFISGVTKCTVTEVEEGDIFVQHLNTGEMRWFPADEFILYEDK